MIILKAVAAIIVGLIFGFFIKYYAIIVSLSYARFCSVNLCCINCKKKVSAADYMKQLIKHTPCKWCQNKLSREDHLIEIAVSIIFAAGAVLIADTIKLIAFCILASFLVVASVVDIKIMKIPYFSSFGVFIVGLVGLIISLFSQNGHWKSQLLGVAFITVLLAMPTLIGKSGGGDFQLIFAGAFVLGLKGAVVAVLIIIFTGFFRSIIETVCTPMSVIDKYKFIIHSVTAEWYSEQKKFGIFLKENRTDTIYLNINNKNIIVDEACYNIAQWSLAPDITLLKKMIENETQNCKFKLATVTRLEQTKDSGFNIRVDCKRIIALAPYISVGILVSYLLCV